MSGVPGDELAALASCFPGATVVPSSSPPVVEVPGVALPTGWSKPAVTVWFVVPSGYPAAQPDCFWTDADLRLTNGLMPQNSGVQTLPSSLTPALWFSWHLTQWRPGRDHLVTYARFIARRLHDPR